MKILICTFEYPPHGSGIANVAFNLRNNFVSRGHKVYVCSPDGPEVKLGSWTLIEKTGGLGILYYWLKAGAFIKKNLDRYDAILLENPMLLHKVYSPKIKATTHTTYLEFWKQVEGHASPFIKLYYWSMKGIEKLCFKRLDKRIRFTSASDDVTEELVKVGIPRKNVKYISNGADVSRFKPASSASQVKRLKKKYGLDPAKEAILFVGRLEYQHRPLELIRIYDIVRKKREGLQLVIVGSGIFKEKMVDLVKELKAKDVIFIPRIEYSHLNEIYQASEYFILNSLYTGQSLAMLEAFASGCLLLVPDITAFKKLLHESQTGCLYHPNDIKKASSQILSYLTKVNRKQEMMRQRAYAERKVDWEVKEYIKYLKMR